jgi:hypothetical protein
MLYNIKGFRLEGGSWSVLSEDGATVAQHYKDECRRLGIYDRADLDRVEVSSAKDSVDVSAGESVSIDLAYIRRRNPDDGGIVDETSTDETRMFEVEIEDPDGMVDRLDFDPTDGAASFSMTPDKAGTWTIRSIVETDEYVDEIATVKGI